MARLYGDEDFDHAVLEALRDLGHDVLSAQEAGQAGQSVPDLDVLAFATQQGRAVLTFNRRHFIALHRKIQTHFGIIVCTRDPDARALAHRIHQTVTRASTMANLLLRINRPPAH
jgi:hypothetical protein